MESEKFIKEQEITEEKERAILAVENLLRTTLANLEMIINNSDCDPRSFFPVSLACHCVITTDKIIMEKGK